MCVCLQKSLYQNSKRNGWKQTQWIGVPARKLDSDQFQLLEISAISFWEGGEIKFCLQQSYSFCNRDLFVITASLFLLGSNIF